MSVFVIFSAQEEVRCLVHPCASVDVCDEPFSRDLRNTFTTLQTYYRSKYQSRIDCETDAVDRLTEERDHLQEERDTLDRRVKLYRQVIEAQMAVVDSAAHTARLLNPMDTSITYPAFREELRLMQDQKETNNLCEDDVRAHLNTFTKAFTFLLSHIESVTAYNKHLSEKADKSPPLSQKQETFRRGKVLLTVGSINTLIYGLETEHAECDHTDVVSTLVAVQEMLRSRDRVEQQTMYLLHDVFEMSRHIERESRARQDQKKLYRERDMVQKKGPKIKRPIMQIKQQIDTEEKNAQAALKDLKKQIQSALHKKHQLERMLPCREPSSCSSVQIDNRALRTPEVIASTPRKDKPPEKSKKHVPGDRMIKEKVAMGETDDEHMAEDKNTSSNCIVGKSVPEKELIPATIPTPTSKTVKMRTSSTDGDISGDSCTVKVADKCTSDSVKPGYTPKPKQPYAMANEANDIKPDLTPLGAERIPSKNQVYCGGNTEHPKTSYTGTPRHQQKTKKSNGTRTTLRTGRMSLSCSGRGLHARLDDKIWLKALNRNTYVIPQPWKRNLNHNCLS